MKGPRVRMIFDITREVQMAIKLQAVKSGRTTGAVVTQAMEDAFPRETAEARDTVKFQEKSKEKA